MVNQDLVMQYQNEGKYLVSVYMITYNHEKYIAQAIESVLMQKTDFPYQLIIGEDYSTDGTRKIVEEYAATYPEKIKAILNPQNLGPMRNAANVYKACTGKYVAMLEGDDYWTDPLKLQRQVDFLEANPDFGMTYSKVRNFIQKKNKYAYYFGGNKETFEELLLGNSIPTLTSCFRVDLWKKYNKDIKPEVRNWLMGDYPMWLYFAKKSKIKFENKVTGVYRVLENSATHLPFIEKEIAFEKSYIEIADFFCDKYCPNNNSTQRKFELYYSWKLFRCWIICQSPQLKEQAVEKIANIKNNKSLKLKIMRLTFSFPIFRYLLVIYDQINLFAIKQRLKSYWETP